MQAISPARLSFLPTAVVTLITVAALALLGMVLAYWTWAWLAPPDEPQAQLAAQAGDPAATATALFGSARLNGNTTAPTGFAITLLGVVADANESGYAILRLDEKETVAVHEGGEIEPGLQLVEVHTDHIVMERGGVRESLAWPDPSKSTAAVAPRKYK